jgi:hypothetical protein
MRRRGERALRPGVRKIAFRRIATVSSIRGLETTVHPVVGGFHGVAGHGVRVDEGAGRALESPHDLTLRTRRRPYHLRAGLAFRAIDERHLRKSRGGRAGALCSRFHRKAVTGWNLSVIPARVDIDRVPPREGSCLRQSRSAGRMRTQRNCDLWTVKRLSGLRRPSDAH